MAFELVYTSIPKGIKQGASGFCTAAYTYGLGPNIIMQLEGLSGYKPIFPHYDANADKNPVAFSHYICSVAGKNIHVLSRICFCGLDYTKRSNKLAHHIVPNLDEMDFLKAGPSSIFHSPGLFLTKWSGEPQLYDTPKKLPLIKLPLHIADTWASYTGDAGWAGVLVQHYLDNPGKPAFIVFDPLKHMDRLSLVDEAMQLIPERKRWSVTFNTYLTTLPAGVKCDWRFCVPGSEALSVARRTPGALVLDLTQSMGAAPDGSLQQIAKTGIAPAVEKKVPASLSASPSSSPSPSAIPRENGIPAPSARQIRSGIPSLTPKQITPDMQVPQFSYGDHPIVVPRKSRATRTAICCIAGAFLLAAAAVGIIWFYADQQDKKRVEAEMKRQAEETEKLERERIAKEKAAEKAKKASENVKDAAKKLKQDAETELGKANRALKTAEDQRKKAGKAAGAKDASDAARKAADAANQKAIEADNIVKKAEKEGINTQEAKEEVEKALDFAKKAGIASDAAAAAAKDASDAARKAADAAEKIAKENKEAAEAAEKNRLEELSKIFRNEGDVTNAKILAPGEILEKAWLYGSQIGGLIPKPIEIENGKVVLNGSGVAAEPIAFTVTSEANGVSIKKDSGKSVKIVAVVTNRQTIYLFGRETLGDILGKKSLTSKQTVSLKLNSADEKTFKLKAVNLKFSSLKDEKKNFLQRCKLYFVVNDAPVFECERDTGDLSLDKKCLEEKVSLKALKALLEELEKLQNKEAEKKKKQEELDNLWKKSEENKKSSENAVVKLRKSFSDWANVNDIKTEEALLDKLSKDKKWLFPQNDKMPKTSDGNDVKWEKILDTAKKKADAELKNAKTAQEKAKAAQEKAGEKAKEKADAKLKDADAKLKEAEEKYKDKEARDAYTELKNAREERTRLDAEIKKAKKDIGECDGDIKKRKEGIKKRKSNDIKLELRSEGGVVLASWPVIFLTGEKQAGEK